jgi:hypothetical protein
MTREQRIEAVLDRFGKYVVQQARANLTRKNKNVSKDLYNSIKWESDASQTGASFSASLSMLPYGDYQDKGVRGQERHTIKARRVARIALVAAQERRVASPNPSTNGYGQGAFSSVTRRASL